MTPMDGAPTVRDNPDESRFQLLLADRVAGSVTYQRRDGVIVLDHTEVAEDYAGRGLGSALARGVFDELRRQAAVVELDCPYLERWLARHPEYAEVVADDHEG